MIKFLKNFHRFIEYIIIMFLLYMVIYITDPEGVIAEYQKYSIIEITIVVVLWTVGYFIYSISKLYYNKGMDEELLRDKEVKHALKICEDWENGKFMKEEDGSVAFRKKNEENKTIKQKIVMWVAYIGMSMIIIAICKSFIEIVLL